MGCVGESLRGIEREGAAAMEKYYIFQTLLSEPFD